MEGANDVTTREQVSFRFFLERGNERGRVCLQWKGLGWEQLSESEMGKNLDDDDDDDDDECRLKSIYPDGQ